MYHKQMISNKIFDHTLITYVQPVGELARLLSSLNMIIDIQREHNDILLEIMYNICKNHRDNNKKYFYIYPQKYHIIIIFFRR